MLHYPEQNTTLQTPAAHAPDKLMSPAAIPSRRGSRGIMHSPWAQNTLSLPGRLVITQRVHGETKITLNAGTSAAARGWAVARYMRNFDTDSSLWRRECERYTKPPPEVVHPTIALGLLSFLDNNQKFAGTGTLKAGYGRLPRRKRFMTPQRILVCEAGAVLESKYGKSGVVLTGTIEGSGDEIARTVAEYSGYIFKRLRQWFRDTLNSDHGVVGVWEWQERGMLHFHIAILSMDVTGLDALMSGFKGYWASIKETISERSGVNLFRKNANFVHDPRSHVSQQDAQWIRQSIARYFSKYTSKEARSTANKGVYCPSRWVTVDRATMREAKLARTKIVLEGFSVQGWKNIFSRISCAVVGVADAVEHFNNPFLKALEGLVFWQDVKEQPRFLDILFYQIEAAQNAGLNLIEH